MKSALAYLRTSSATNAGEDKDSHRRQLAAIEAYARGKYHIVQPPFYDAAVKGSDPIDTRPGFAGMLAYIDRHDVRTIIVENASRFARDVITAECGFRMLQQRGITLISADSPDQFIDDTPTATLIRQILACVAQFEKAALVAKLAGARQRIKATTGKCEGRKSNAERDPEAANRARWLRRKNRRTGKRLSYRAIAEKLAEQGYTTRQGKPYSPSAVISLINGA